LVPVWDNVVGDYYLVIVDAYYLMGYLGHLYLVFMTETLFNGGEHRAYALFPKPGAFLNPDWLDYWRQHSDFYETILTCNLCPPNTAHGMSQHSKGLKVFTGFGPHTVELFPKTNVLSLHATGIVSMHTGDRLCHNGGMLMYPQRRAF